MKASYPFRLLLMVSALGLAVALGAATFSRAGAVGAPPGAPPGPGAQIAFDPPNGPSSPLPLSNNPQPAGLSDDLGLGVLIGWFMLLAGFGLLIWSTQRDLAGLYYLLAMLFILALLLTAGLGPGASLGEFGLVWIALVAAFIILFVEALLAGKRLSPGLHRLMWPALSLWVLLGIASIWAPPAWMQPLLGVLAGLTAIYLATLALAGLARGYRPAAYLTVGLVVVLVGWIVGLAPAGRLAGWLPGVALMAMALLFAAALYDHQLYTRANLERSYLSLRESESRLQQYLEALPFAAAVLAPDESLVWVNRRFVNLFAPDCRPENFPTSLKELFYRYPIFKAGSPELYPAEGFPAGRALQGEALRVDDVELERGEGRFPLSVWAEPLLDGQRKPAAALVLCQDISARRQSEQELARHVQELQLMVDLRLEELRYEHEDRKKVESILHRLATTDPLTGLNNRRHWSNLAARYLLQSARYHHPLSLILVDIDHFQYVNEIYGQRVGDETLVRIAETIRDTLRNVDLLARYAGDEFIVLLPDTDQAGAEVVAERLRERVANLMIEGSKGPVAVTLSIGLAELDPQDDLLLEHLIEQADLALYGAKHGGRNRVMTYAPLAVD